MNEGLGRGFQLSEVVRATAVALYVSAVFVPVVVAARPSGDDGLAKRLHLLGTSMLMYASDADERLPLAYSIQGDVWQTNSATPTPSDWRPSTTAEQRAGYAVAWANSMEPYFKAAKADLALPRTKAHRHAGWDRDYAHPVARRRNASMSFNGLLHAWSISAIALPGKLPLLWSAWGNVHLDGYVQTSPALNCRRPETEEHCVYRRADMAQDPSGSNNGTSSMLYQPYGSMRVVGRTAPFVNADSSVVFVKLGAVAAPKSTDNKVDPFTQYDGKGNPMGYYWFDGLHVWLFRPDRKE